ncbi:MAG: hypothetical protein OSB19_13490, partial [Opitutaceae bacterium]|nr:hypothetical protein [Opitutaceae bacterium]
EQAPALLKTHWFNVGAGLARDFPLNKIAGKTRSYKYGLPSPKLSTHKKRIAAEAAIRVNNFERLNRDCSRPRSPS